MKKILYFMSAMLFLVSCDRKGQMVSLAEENIRQSVDYPKELKIIAVSEPDSAFGIHYFTQKEVKGMMLMMQKVSESIMKRTNNMTEFNPEDHYVMELAERQMRAMSEILAMIHQTGRKGEWSGWKIKVDYEARNKDGVPYKAERWLFLDKDGKNIFNSFEIPIP